MLYRCPCSSEHENRLFFALRSLATVIRQIMMCLVLHQKLWVIWMEICQRSAMIRPQTMILCVFEVGFFGSVNDTWWQKNAFFCVFWCSFIPCTLHLARVPLPFLKVHTRGGLGDESQDVSRSFASCDWHFCVRGSNIKLIAHWFQGLRFPKVCY